MEATEEKTKGLVSLLEDKWIGIEDMPEYYSFKCLIKFKQFGIFGLHVSMGYWDANNQCFEIHDEEMINFDPDGFYPINDSFSIF